MDNKEKSLRYINFPVMEEGLCESLMNLGAKLILQQNGRIIGATFCDSLQAQQAKEIAADDFDRQFVVKHRCLFNNNFIPW